MFTNATKGCIVEVQQQQQFLCLRFCATIVHHAVPQDVCCDFAKIPAFACASRSARFGSQEGLFVAIASQPGAAHESSAPNADRLDTRVKKACATSSNAKLGDLRINCSTFAFPLVAIAAIGSGSESDLQKER
jgi:hypothetical protein